MVLALAAAGLAAPAVLQLVALDRERSELLRTARELEVDEPDLDRILARAEDPDPARITLARTLLVRALETDPATAGASPLRARRLEAAAGLARSVLGRRPASWEAATIAGAATYLAWSLERDPRLLQEYRAWEEPLLLARRLAPGRREPSRYLVAAYLELWPALSDAKRELTRELVAGALEEPRAFGRLIEPWLEISGGDLGPVPDAPWAWAGVGQVMSRRRDWASFCHAWETGRTALRAELAARLREAERLLRGGELLEARKALLAIADSAPPDRSFAELVDRALRAIPHGPAPSGPGRPLARWLTWSLDQALLGEPPLGLEALGRLRAVVAGNGSRKASHLAAAAWTHLAAGDLVGAERVESRGEATWTADWSPYWIEKARFLAARGEPAAGETLARVHPDWRSRAVFWLARQTVAEAAGDRAAAAEARAELAAVAARAWSALDWSWSGSRAWIDLYLARDAGVVEIAVAEAPSGGAAVALTLDGAALGCLPAASGETLSVAVALPPGLHRLELDPAASGGRVWPGPVTVREAPRPRDRPAPRPAPPRPPPPAPPG